MNKTLLLILCDFLLLNLLALTRWEKAEPVRASQAPVPVVAANAVTREQDLVEVMRQSLDEERALREDLARQLSATGETLSQREERLAEMEAERNRLAGERTAVADRLEETRAVAEELEEKVSSATQEATLTRDQLAQLQRELAEREAEVRRQQQAYAQLEERRAAAARQAEEARRQVQGLTLAVVVAEQEKKNLRETTEALKEQVAAERSERLKVQEVSTRLAQGVGQLTEKSVELTREIRENRPINANVLFSEFLANRVTANFQARRQGFLGPVERSEESGTVLVTDGREVYALLHVADTIFSLSEFGDDWESLRAEVSRGGGQRSAVDALSFLALDPRIVALPLDGLQAAALGAKVYPLATDLFKFPEAVLIDADGGGYGEVSFKLDPAEPNYVRVDNRLFKRLFGDFSPSAGDLVLSKTGELLGMMVNKDYCAVLKNFDALQDMRTGPDIRAQSTAGILDRLVAQVRSLPLKLQ